MIAYLSGKIKNQGDNFIIVENQGIGYKVFVSANLKQEKKNNEQVEFYIYQNVKEDALDLYGFESMESLDLFEKLISVSGIGPKTALGAFSVAKIQDIKSAIVNQDATILKTVSGIGAKTAERIVLELKNKIGGVVGVDLKSKETMTEDQDALEALESLGYARYQAQQALQQVDADITDVSVRVKEALKSLAK